MIIILIFVYCIAHKYNEMFVNYRLLCKLKQKYYQNTQNIIIMEQEAISVRFTRLRKALELNQRDFAQKIGTIQATVSYIETGGKPSYDVMEGVFTGIENINFTWLVSGKGEMFTTDKGRGDIEELEGKIKIFEEETKNLKRREEIYLTTIESLSKR